MRKTLLLPTLLPTLLLPLAALHAATASGMPAQGMPANEVLRWNVVATDVSATAETDPLTESRDFAILHLAILDAVEDGGSVAAAAHEVLTHLFPAGRPTFDRALDEARRSLPAGAAGERTLAVGREAARAVLADRRNDGAERSVPYRKGSKPGEYRPTPPDMTPAFMVQWGGIRPFALKSASQFRPTPPPAVGSERGKGELQAVRAVGGATSLARTDEQGEIARFWYEHSTQGWNRIARNVAEARGLDLRETARLLALVNVAMADGFIAGFEAKYHYAYWRPVTAIREAGEEAWLPYLVTPPVPDHPSTHTVLGAAAAAVLARYFGTDFVEFEMTSGAPYPGITRRFYGFSDAARENGASRVFAGIHFPTAVADGYVQGEAVGAWVFDHALTASTRASKKATWRQSARASAPDQGTTRAAGTTR